MDQAAGYVVSHETPSIETYLRLRREAGLSGKTQEAAARGLPTTLFAVQVLMNGEVLGMGRVVGDGGCFFRVVDIAVQPAHQGRGVGKQIMGEIMQYLQAHVPQSGYVSLIADGQAQALYAQYGFTQTAPRSVGMAWMPPLAV